MKVAIVGYDVEGKANYEYWSAQGYDITICDQKTDLDIPQGAESVLGEHYLDDLDRFDLIVRTAGLSPKKILGQNPNVADKITSQINEFMRVCPTKNIIGITGTKGKGTTSTLIYKMLEASGKDVYLGGNIGITVFSFLNKLTVDSWVILELSSFQLIDLRQAPHIGVCLMVVPEHLNWHDDLNEYIASKSQLFKQQKPDSIAIYFANNRASKQIVETSPGNKIQYFTPPGAFIEGGNIVIAGETICPVSDIKLLGEHNLQNVCAAVTAVWQVNQGIEAVRSVLTSFTGLPHRLELVRELDGVRYYDDSFGTTPETATVAIQAFKEPKIVVLGGSDKGSDYAGLAKTVKSNNVRKVILIGEQAGRIQAALEQVGYTDFVGGGQTMAEIVNTARQAAQPGDIVLLSTACASFDIFANYKDRGEKFSQAVQSLA